MDSDSEDEIFFGRITEKEKKIAENIRNRRTEIFEPCGPLFQRRSSAPSLSSQEEKDEQEGENDSKASLLVPAQDLTSSLPSANSGQLFLNESSDCGSSSQLFQCIFESEIKDQEALFVFTPSHKGVKRYSEYCDGNNDISLCVRVNESKNSCTSQSLSRPDSFHTSADSALQTNSYSEVSVEKPRIFSNESMSEESVHHSLQSLETQLCDLSEHFTQVDRNGEEAVELLPTTKSAKEVLLEASLEGEKVLFAALMHGEKMEPGITDSGAEIVIETSVSGENSELEVLVSGGKSVSETLVRQNSLPKTTIGGGSSVPETKAGRGNFTLEANVSGRDSMPETLVRRGDSIAETTVGKENCVLETTVGGGENVPETSVVGGESLPRTTVGRGSSVSETTVGRGSSVPETTVSGGDNTPETSASGGDSVSENTDVRGDCVSETTGSRGDSVPETTCGRGDRLLETTGYRGNCLPGTTIIGEDSMPETTASGGDNVPRNIVPEITLFGGNCVLEKTSSRRNNVPENIFNGNSVLQTLINKGDIVPKTLISERDRMSEASVTGVVNVPKIKVSREECIPETSFNGGNSKPEMKVSGGDSVTESTVGGGNNVPEITVVIDSVPEIAVIGGAGTFKTSITGGDSVLETAVNRGSFVSDVIVSGGDIVSESTISQGDCVVEFEENDLKAFQRSHSRELICKTSGDGENVTKPLPSVGLMMNGSLSVQEDPAADSVGKSYTAESQIIFDKELKKLSKVRQSYYSGLDVINVDSSEVYGNFLIEEDLLGAVDCELPCSYQSNQKPCTYISRTSKSYSDHVKQEEVSFGQIAEKGVLLSVDSSEGDDSVFTSENENLKSQDCDIPYHERYSVWHQKSTVEGDCMVNERDTESLKGEDSVFATHGQTNTNNQDNFISCERKCRESNISVNDDVKLVNNTMPLPGSQVLAASYEDCLKSSVTVIPPPTSLTFLSISPTDIENVQCSVLATPSLASPQSPFPQNKGVNSNSNGIDVESYGSTNKALVSHMEDFITSSSCTFSKVHHISGSSNENLKFKSPVHEIFHQLMPNGSQKSCDTSTDSVQGMQSPPNKFNDTIEEMEMMLKYGVDYVERATENTVPLDMNEKISSHSDKLGNYYDQNYGNAADDPIRSPTRKSSVASMISNFHPALESTRSSSLQEDSSVQRKLSENMETLDAKTVRYPCRSDSGTKKEPPPKPPRNVHSPNVSPKKYSSFKASTPSTPKHLAVSSLGVGEQSHVQKNIVPSKGFYASKAASPRGRDKKAKVFTPKQSGVLKLGRCTPGLQPVTSDSGLANMEALTNLQKSKLGQLPAGTTVSTHSTVRLQHQSPGSRQNTPTLQRSSGTISRKPVTNSGLPPRPTPNKTGKSVLKQTPNQTTKLHTPKERNNAQPKINLASKTQSPTLLRYNRLHLKQGLNIVSPVAKYLKENPPPPLVVNIKPRHKISPKKIQSESSPTKKSSYQAGTGKCANIQQQISPKVPRDHEPIKMEISPVREAALSRIQDDLERLALKMKNGQTCVKEKEPGEPVHFTEEDHVLPVAMYSSSGPALMDVEENKENKRGRRCREIPTDKQPAIVVKHKGRMKMPKVTFKEGPVESASPKGYRSPAHMGQDISSPQTCQSVRGSLMEISLYESHATQYTNTLH